MKFIVALLLLVLLPPLSFALVDGLRYASEHGDVYLPFAIGMLVYVMLLGIRSRRLRHNIGWAQIFSHEFTHLVFSLLTFNRIQGFEANSYYGGSVTYQGRSNMIITLSPYCIPLFTLILLLLSPLFNPSIQPYFLGVMGLTYLFHLHAFKNQTQKHQPDLQQNGWLFSLLFILTFNLLFAAILVWFIPKGMGGFKHLAALMWEHGELLIGQFKR